jgi:hypothetical protein
MKAAILTAAIMLTCYPTQADDLEKPLERDALLPGSPAAVWTRALTAVRGSRALVLALDEPSRLLSLVFPLSRDEVRDSVLEGNQVSPAPQIAHAVIWCRPAETGTRVYVRVAIGSQGQFERSNGKLERELLDVLRSGSAWRSDSSAALRVAGTPQELRRTLELLGCETHDFQPDNGLLTCRASMSIATLKLYTQEKPTGYHPGALYLTAWFSSEGPELRVALRRLFVEVGKYGTADLLSNGKLDQRLSAELVRSSTVLQTAARIGDTAVEQGDFLWEAFGPPMVGAPAHGQHAPDPTAEAWGTLIQVLSQSSVIVNSDGVRNTLTYMAAHPAKAALALSIHSVTLRLEPDETGLTFFVNSHGGSDGPEEFALERQVLLEKIATQRFLRTQVRWLVKE